MLGFRCCFHSDAPQSSSKVHRRNEGRRHPRTLVSTRTTKGAQLATPAPYNVSHSSASPRSSPTMARMSTLFVALVFAASSAPTATGFGPPRNEVSETASRAARNGFKRSDQVTNQVTNGAAPHQTDSKIFAIPCVVFILPAPASVGGHPPTAFPHLASPRLGPPRPTSPRLTSHHLTPPHTTSPSMQSFWCGMESRCSTR